MMNLSHFRSKEKEGLKTDVPLRLARPNKQHYNEVRMGSLQQNAITSPSYHYNFKVSDFLRLKKPVKPPVRPPPPQFDWNNLSDIDESFAPEPTRLVNNLKVRVMTNWDEPLDVRWNHDVIRVCQGYDDLKEQMAEMKQSLVGERSRRMMVERDLEGADTYWKCERSDLQREIARLKAVLQNEASDEMQADDEPAQAINLTNNMSIDQMVRAVQHNSMLKFQEGDQTPPHIEALLLERQFDSLGNDEQVGQNNDSHAGGSSESLGPDEVTNSDNSDDGLEDIDDTVEKDLHMAMKWSTEMAVRKNVTIEEVFPGVAAAIFGEDILHKPKETATGMSAPKQQEKPLPGLPVDEDKNEVQSVSRRRKPLKRTHTDISTPHLNKPDMNHRLSFQSDRKGFVGMAEMVGIPGRGKSSPQTENDCVASPRSIGRPRSAYLTVPKHMHLREDPRTLGALSSAQHTMMTDYGSVTLNREDSARSILTANRDSPPKATTTIEAEKEASRAAKIASFHGVFPRIVVDEPSDAEDLAEKAEKGQQRHGRGRSTTLARTAALVASKIPLFHRGTEANEHGPV